MERKSNFVSVIIPCYNHGAFIHEAIQSILNQSFRNFEIIVVNDGSTDASTVRILKQLNMPRTTVYHTENRRLSAARNFGISKSLGEYILPLDSDDRFAPTYLEKAVEILKNHPETGVVTCHFKRFGTTSKKAAATLKPPGGSLTDFLAQNNSCGNALFRHRCWEDAGGYDETLHGFEDWDFWIGVTRKGWLIRSIPEVLFFYRDTPGSMYKTVEKNRPQLVSQIAAHHREAYSQHVVQVLHEKEIEIQILSKRIKHLKDQNRNLLAYRARKLSRAPFKWARMLFDAQRAEDISGGRPG